MIVVDTSVWVNAFRSALSNEATILPSLLDADEVILAVPVKSELLSGAARRDLAPLRRALSALPVLYPSDETWQIIETWIERASPVGQRFGLGDLLIAALARESGSLIWSLDADFARMSRMGFIDLYEP